MNEAETRAELIDPALRRRAGASSPAAGSAASTITPAASKAPGGAASRDIADYVLTYRNHKLAVIEAKAWDKADTEGVGAGQGLCREAAGALRLFHQRPAHLRHRHGDRRGGLCRRAIRRRTNSGTDVFAEAERLARPLRRRAVRGQGRHLADALLPGHRHRARAGGDRRRQAAHPADARHRHRQDLHRLPDRLEAVPEPLEPEPRSRRGGRASCSWPTATSWPTRPTTPSPPSPRTRWCASSRTRSARKAACRRTPASSSHLPDLHERHRRRTASPRPISATIRRTSSTSSSSTSAIAAARTTKATGATSSTISRRPCSSA